MAGTKRTMHVDELLPNAVDQERAIKSNDQHKMSRQMSQRFLWEPRRVAQILRHFFERAMKNDKVLLDYMQYTLPGFKLPEQGAGVTVIIQAPTIDAPPGKFGPDGKPVIEVEKK